MEGWVLLVDCLPAAAVPWLQFLVSRWLLEYPEARAQQEDEIAAKKTWCEESSPASLKFMAYFYFQLAVYSKLKSYNFKPTILYVYGWKWWINKNIITRIGVQIWFRSCGCDDLRIELGYAFLNIDRWNLFLADVLVDLDLMNIFLLNKRNFIKYSQNRCYNIRFGSLCMSSLVIRMLLLCLDSFDRATQ